MDNTFDSLYYQDNKLVAGVDESGVSDIAGPLVAACVILPRVFEDLKIFEVNDCKKVPERYREQYAVLIRQHATAIGIGVTEAREVDYLGKRKSIILAMIRSIAACQTAAEPPKGILPDIVLVDGELELPISIKQVCLKDGDLKSLSIASASIIAKVYRDGLMLKYHEQTPYYGWNKNKGAPCENQLKGMDEHGIQLGIHRTGYYPFVPNREKKENDRHLDWRRGQWRRKTMEKLTLKLNEDWICKEK